MSIGYFFISFTLWSAPMQTNSPRRETIANFITEQYLAVCTRFVHSQSKRNLKFLLLVPDARMTGQRKEYVVLPSNPRYGKMVIASTTPPYAANMSICTCTLSVV
jgi:hypothetical protein